LAGETEVLGEVKEAEMSCEYSWESSSLLIKLTVIYRKYISSVNEDVDVGYELRL
jgi:hypothetical protein